MTHDEFLRRHGHGFRYVELWQSGWRPEDPLPERYEWMLRDWKLGGGSSRYWFLSYSPGKKSSNLPLKELAQPESISDKRLNPNKAEMSRTAIRVLSSVPCFSNSAIR